MPIYTYACTACGAVSEVRQSFTDDALTECTVCGGALRKRYDAVGVTFNGSGFYRTDSRASESASKSGPTKSAAASAAPKAPATTGGGSSSGS